LIRRHPVDDPAFCLRGQFLDKLGYAVTSVPGDPFKLEPGADVQDKLHARFLAIETEVPFAIRTLLFGIGHRHVGGILGWLRCNRPLRSNPLINGYAVTVVLGHRLHCAQGQHLSRYGFAALDPYMLSLDALVERFCFEIGDVEGGGVIAAEQQDRRLWFGSVANKIGQPPATRSDQPCSNNG
jgi:hypothetical protein